MPFTLPARPSRQAQTFELRAGTDFNAIDQALDDAVQTLLAAWQDVRSTQIVELADQVRAIGADPARLAQISATPRGTEMLTTVLETVAEDAAAGARAEAIGQGAPSVDIDLDALRVQVAARASAIDVLLASELSQAARRQAIARLGVDELAGEVEQYLNTLTDSWLRDQFNGAVTTAAGLGRQAVMVAVTDLEEQPVEFYISALMDTNTCSVCGAWDGQRFATLNAALEQAPTGRNKDCLGGPRCRCTIVAVYPEAPATA